MSDANEATLSCKWPSMVILHIYAGFKRKKYAGRLITVHSSVHYRAMRSWLTAPLVHILVGYATNEKAFGAVSVRIVRDKCILNL